MVQSTLLACIVCILLSSSLVLSQIAVPQTQVDTIDASIQSLLLDSKFQSDYSSYIPFNVPTCAEAKVKYPTTNPFASRKTIRACYESDAVFPWLNVFQLVGNGIVRMINQQYGVSLSAEFLALNTSSLGFFNTMKKAVYDGSCDVCVSNTTPTQVRKDQVKFQVGFSDGF